MVICRRNSRLGLHLNTPAFLRREGRRKRKAGAKNEKAIIIIADFPKRSIKKLLNNQSRYFFSDIILSKDRKVDKNRLITSKMIILYPT
jgi:hypothetical protein